MYRQVETLYCPVDLYDQIGGDLDRIDEVRYARPWLSNP